MPVKREVRQPEDHRHRPISGYFDSPGLARAAPGLCSVMSRIFMILSSGGCSCPQGRAPLCGLCPLSSDIGTPAWGRMSGGCVSTLVAATREVFVSCDCVHPSHRTKLGRSLDPDDALLWACVACMHTAVCLCLLDASSRSRSAICADLFILRFVPCPLRSRKYLFFLTFRFLYFRLCRTGLDGGVYLY